MRDVIAEVLPWWRAGHTVGAATVVATFESAPRPPGATMLVTPDGAAVGSISGGCVEGAAYELAPAAARGAAPSLHRFGVADDDAFIAGLTCGGIIDIFVEPLSRLAFPELGQVAQDIAAGRSIATVTIVDDDRNQVGRRLVVQPNATIGTLGGESLDMAVAEDARGMLAAGTTGMRHCGAPAERRAHDVNVFVSSFSPPPRMIVFGAIDFAAAVARVGKSLGDRVTVCDARPALATRRRSPEADEVIVSWPHRYLAETHVNARTVICVLTHDPKFNVPLLEIALRLPVAYVGAMGSPRTHQKRLAQPHAVGVSDSDLSRLSSPIGLDLGGRTPEETAVSVAAEVIALNWGGSRHRLCNVESPTIHPDFRRHGSSEVVVKAGG